jgi:hypothetical protein
MATAHFDSSGNAVQLVTAPIPSDDGASLVRDGDAIYVSGRKFPVQPISVIVIKYDRDLNEQWTRVFDQGCMGLASHVPVAVDPNGDVWVAWSASVGGVTHHRVAKLDPNGDLIWTHDFDVFGELMTARDLVYSPVRDQMVMIGDSPNPGWKPHVRAHDVVTGDPVWMVTYPGPPSLAGAITVDSQGFLIAGFNRYDQQPKAVLRKLAP